jgi:hypothetical protein
MPTRKEKASNIKAQTHQGAKGAGAAAAVSAAAQAEWVVQIERRASAPRIIEALMKKRGCRR